MLDAKKKKKRKKLLFPEHISCRIQRFSCSAHILLVHRQRNVLVFNVFFFFLINACTRIPTDFVISSFRFFSLILSFSFSVHRSLKVKFNLIEHAIYLFLSMQIQRQNGNQEQRYETITYIYKKKWYKKRFNNDALNIAAEDV